MNFRTLLIPLACSLAVHCGGPKSHGTDQVSSAVLRDSAINELYQDMLTLHDKDATFVVSQDAALRLLARVGDRRGRTSNVVLRQLVGSELTHAEKIQLVRDGMTANEKQDLADIVDGRALPLSAEAHGLLEEVLQRTSKGLDGLSVTSDQSTGISGKAQPADAIEAINLSAAATLRLHVDDTTEIATADASGNYQGSLSGEQVVKAGDVVRLRARHSNGTRSDWVTLKAQGSGLGQDVSNAQVAAFRIGLFTQGTGMVSVSNINDGREISEPGASLQFSNLTSGERTVVTLNDQGTFPAGTQVKGQPGDKFALAVTDGTNNGDFSTALAISPLVVPDSGVTTDLVPDPTALKTDQNADGSSKFGKHRFTGPLFEQAFTYTDPRQGQIGDCYFPSGIAAMGVNHAAEVQNAIVDNGDGTFIVHFKQAQSAAKYTDVPVKVDGDLYVRSFGGPVYGASMGSNAETSMKLLFPLFEKAYATWKGGYEQIGNGGLSNDVFEAVLGKPGRYVFISEGATDLAWQEITAAVDAKRPVSAGTYGDTEQARYINTGIYADHSYSVISYDAATHKVTLRNPWGESEPPGNGPNDGIFELDMPTFAHLFNSVMTVQN